LKLKPVLGLEYSIRKASKQTRQNSNSCRQKKRNSILPLPHRLRHFQANFQVAGGNGSMQKNQVSMTNHSSLELENIAHACHFVVGTWHSNFCHGLATL